MTSLQTKTRNLEKIFQVLDEGGGLRSGGAIHKDRKFNRGSLWRGDEDFRFGKKVSANNCAQTQMEQYLKYQLSDI